MANILIALLPALLAAAAIFDLLTFTIPNSITGAIVVLFAIIALVLVLSGAPPELDSAGLHLAAGLVGFAAGAGLFAAGIAGGGDAKLFTACALWLGWPLLFDYLMLSAILGGALTLALLMLRAMPLPPALMANPALSRLIDRKQGVPYGVALAAAAQVLLPQSELFRQAAGV
jgi:prepilin peptidase CpaA